MSTVKASDREVVEETLSKIDAGEMSFGDLPEEMRQQALREGRIEIPGDDGAGGAGDIDALDAPPPPPPGDTASSSSATTPSRAVGEDDLAGLQQKYREKAAAANTEYQKRVSREKEMERIAKDPDYRDRWLKKRNYVPGSDPTATALQILTDEDAGHAHARMDQLHREIAINPLDIQRDNALAERVDLGGETFSQADSKWSEIYQALDGNVEKLQELISDEDKQRELGLEMPNNPEAYFATVEAVRLWNEKGVPLDKALSVFAKAEHLKTGSQEVSSQNNSDLAKKRQEAADLVNASKRKEGEVSTMSTVVEGSLSAEANAEAIMSRRDDIIERSKSDPSSITQDDRDFMKKLRGE